MATVISRAGWTDIARPDTLRAFDGRALRGLAVHWTGSPVPVGQSGSYRESIRRLREDLRFHTDPVAKGGRGWSDFAYNYAIDAAGRVFEGRGLRHRSAANGNQTVNGSHGAVLFMTGTGDTPSQAMVDAFVEWRAEVWLPTWPFAAEVVGHRDLSSTECPGETIYKMVRAGVLAAPDPAEEKGDDMPLTDTDIDRIAHRVADMVTGAGARHPVLVDPGTGAARLDDGRDVDALPTVVGEIQHDQRAQTRLLARVEESLARIEAALGECSARREPAE